MKEAAVKTDLSQMHMTNLFKLLFRLQLFITGTSAVSNIVGSIFTGLYLNSDAVAVIGLFGPVSSFIAALSAVVSSGMTVLYGKVVSDGTKRDMNQIFTTSVIFGAAIGLISTVVLVSCAYPLAKLLGASDNLAGLFVEYAEGMSIGLVFRVLVPLLMSFLQFGHKPRITIHAILILMVSTIVFDYIMLVPLHAGVRGMAFATAIANIITFAYIVVRFLTDRELMRLKPNLFSFRLVGKTVLLGSPGAVSYLMWALRNGMISRLAAEWGGDRALTALSVRGTVDTVTTSLFNVALGGALLILFSVMVAEENREAIVNLIKRVLLKYLPIWILMVVLALALAEPIASIYVKPDDIQYTAAAIRGFAPVILVSYPVNAFFALYKSLRKMAMINILYVFNALVFPIGAALIATQIFGIAGVWNLYWMGEALTILLVVGIAWVYNKRFPKRLDDLCLFPKGFGIPTSECITFTVQGIPEIELASEKAIEFSKARGISSKRSMHVGLCVEEISRNIFMYGFSKPHRHPENDLIDIRLCHRDGDMVLRLWDNVPIFDPYARAKQLGDANPTSDVGIRLVFKLVKNAEYKTCFNENILTVRI